MNQIIAENQAATQNQTQCGLLLSDTSGATAHGDQEPSRHWQKWMENSLPKHAMEGSSGLKNGSGQGLTTGRPTHEVELIEDISGGEWVGPADWRHPREAPGPVVPSDAHSAPRWHEKSVTARHENRIKGAVPCTQEKSRAGEQGDYCGRKTETRLKTLTRLEPVRAAGTRDRRLGSTARWTRNRKGAEWKPQHEEQHKNWFRSSTNTEAKMNSTIKISKSIFPLKSRKFTTDSRWSPPSLSHLIEN
jgi:hypothetical protein